ncbi:MAG: hypothetical protein R3A45_09605 [Bdellovibrionota bacterium]
MQKSNRKKNYRVSTLLRAEQWNKIQDKRNLPRCFNTSLHKLVFFITAVGILFSSPLCFAQNTTASTGYRDGFYLKTDDDKFLLKFGSRLNALYSYGVLDQEADISSFDLKHGKVYFGGHAFSKSIQFYVQSSFAQNSRSNAFGLMSENNVFTLEDYYVRGNYGDISLQMGQFKVPFSKQYMIYTGNLQFVTRSIASNAFQFGRDRGVTLAGKKPWLSYMLGLYNGASQMTVPSITQLTNSINMSNDTIDTGMTYLARLSLFPRRPAGFSEGDTAFNEASRLELGISLALDQGRDYDTNNDTLTDDTGVNTFSLASDFTFLHRGFSLQGEFYYRNHHFESLPNASSYGFYGQAGYFIVPRSLEIAGRYSWLEPNTDTFNDRASEISGVVSYLMSKNHKHKMQWQYSRIHQDVFDKTDHWFHWMLQLTI